MLSTPDEGGIPLSILNYPASRLPGPNLLHELVQTNPQGEHPAVDFLPPADATQNSSNNPYGQPRSLSYKQLHDASDLLASRIWDLARSDATYKKFIVPVLLPQGPELYTTLLAILKTGGAFCPLNLDVPLERARFILQDVSATVVITSSELASRIPNDAGQIVILRIDETLFSSKPVSSRPKDLKLPLPNDLAYVMYTSGSTGTPKGVGVSHDAATQSLLAHDRHIPQFSRFLQFAAPTFDVSVFEIFFPFFRGKTLVSCTRPTMLNDLPGVIRSMNVDACELTPTVAGSLLRKRANAPGLKLLLTIGEMLTKPVLEEFGSGADGKESILWAMYGPTEAAIHCTLQSAFSHDSGVGNIGIPFDTVSAFILPIPTVEDSPEQPGFTILPRGEVGELVVGGYQTADGYLNRQEMIAKAFVDTPYGRLYRTGDKARIRADGTLECLGRISEGQVKLRGQRIELGEIEHAALRTAGCHSAFASVIRNILVLFCAVDDTNGTDTAAMVQKSCRNWLPGFMVPGDIIAMKEFPRLPSGKVDRKRLVAEYEGSMGALDNVGRVAEASPTKLLDEIEAKLCSVASGILGTNIAPDQHLSRAGMDSLVAIKLASSLREVSIEVAVADILHSKTISILRGRVKQTGKMISSTPSSSFGVIGSGGLDVSGVISVIPALGGFSEKEITGIYPCTPLQTAMLSETKASPGAYCNWVELSFPLEYEKPAILSSFRKIAQDNEALRTGFVHDGDRFLQVVFTQPEPSFATFVDPGHLVKEFEISTDRDFLRPFRLQMPESQDGKGSTVIVQVHHAVYDGWSMDMVLSELETLLESQATTTPQPPEVMAPSPSAEPQTTKGLGKFPKTITQSLMAFARSSKTLVRLPKGPRSSRSPTNTPREPPKTPKETPSTHSPKSRPQFHQVVTYYQSAEFQQDCEVAREYWAANLAGFQPPPLPILRGEEQSSPGVASAVVALDIPSSLVKEALDVLEVPPQTIFQAAVAWLWGALTGVEDVVIGTVTSGRTVPVPRIENILGPCIASVPLRTNLAKVLTVQDLITSIHAANRAVLRHGVLPLSEIKKVAGFRPGQSIYDVVFVYQESLHSRPDSTRKVKQVSQRDYLETKVLIEIERAEDVDFGSRSQFRCRLTYHTDFFTKEYINFFGQSFEAIFMRMLGKFALKISSLQQAFPREALSAHNVAPKRFKGVTDLALAVESTATKCPGKDALCFAEQISEDVFKTTTITYSGLNKLANQIAWLLRQHGAVEGEAVAIVMEKSVLLYAGILAILKLGCAYLPLLPSTPSNRVDTIFSQANIKLCITDTATRAAVGASLSCKLVDIQSVRLDALPISNPNHTVDPRRISYIIYTSGSTGVPKGVCVTQLNIMSNLDVLSRIYPVRNDSRLLQSCSQAFDVSVFEIFFAWTQGICLCSAPNDVLFADLEYSIRKLGVTHLSMTPTVASLVNPYKVPMVEFLVTSGEAMTEVVARKWARQLYQGYGPSETTNICSVKKMYSESGTAIIQHLGWSFGNTSTFVLFKDSMELVPKGCFGELCFGGDQVAQGYLNMPELTAIKFINHPKYGRLYRSGDLGRMLPDGSMVITGRVDDQIKIRGQRVELGEITSIVSEHEIVADCTTLYLKEGDSGNGQIVVFIVSKKSHEPEFRVLEIDSNLSTGVQDIYQQLTARVPGYMIPSLIIPVTVLPVTPAGKLDRRRLGDTVKSLNRDYLIMAGQRIGLNPEQDDGLWTDIERQVTGVLAAVFRVDMRDIRRWTPLTTLGLDSISAIGVSKQLQEKLNSRITISTILRSPSVAKLAEALSEVPHHPAVPQPGKQTELLPVKITKSIIATLNGHGKRAERILPCTPLQEAMLVASGRGSYLNTMLFRVNGSPESLVMAWKTMCKRHSILRTCFMSTEDTRWPVVQVILHHWEHPWLNFDSSQNDVEGCVADHVKTLPNAIDTTQPAVSFATISQAGAIYLSFVCHHALYDGIAMERLLFEVEQVVSGVNLPAPPTYEAFLQESLQLQSTNSVEFWLNQLDGHKPKLLTGFKTGESDPNLHPSITRNLDITLSQVNNLTKQLGVSLLSVTQSAWALTLAIIFRTEDVCFGNVLSGRTMAIDRIEELVAPCFNTVPIRMDLANLGSRNLDLMNAFHTLSSEVLQHQCTPLRQILQSFASHASSQAVEENQGSGQSGRLVLFDSLLLLQHPPRPLDKAVWSLEMDEGGMDVPVVCEIIPDTHFDLLTVKLHLEPNRFPLELPCIILDLFFHALRSLLCYPESRLLLQNSISTELRKRLDQLPYEEPLGLNVDAPIPDDDKAWTTTESTIRSVLSALSSRPPSRILRHTTIYQLGLDSISAVQIAFLLRKQGLNLAASDVISNPTCEGLARYIDEIGEFAPKQEPTYDLSRFQNEVRSQVDKHGIPLDMVEDILPCSPLQVGMMTKFIQSGGKDYFNYIGFRLDDDSIHLEAVVEAWKKLYQAHPVLRTRLVPIEHNDHPFALVQLAPTTPPVQLLTRVGEQANGFHTDKWRLDAAHAAAVAIHSQPWSVSLVRTEKGTMMHLAIHHCLYDAHSLQMLLADLAKGVRGAHILPSPRHNIRAAVIDILGQISASARPAQEFWESQADKTVINSFPVMTPLRESPRKILVESMASDVPFSNLERAVAETGYTIQVVLQAAWTRILSSYLGESSVVFGVVLSGRNSEATQDAMFPCITTLPVISKHSGSNHDLLQRMLGFNTGLFKQQHQPLTRIQSWLGLPDTKLFDTLLVYQKFNLDTSDTRPWRIVDDQAAVDYPVSIEVEPQQGDRLKYQITFFSDFLSKEQARIILQQFDAVVRHLAMDPTGSEDDLIRQCPDIFSILPPHRPELPAPVKFLHQFVEKQAAESPDATALHFVESFEGRRVTGRKWTYQELNHNGNRVANMILPNVKTGDLIAINFDKCPEAYFSILGVLKAGCSFVALDPGAPASRKQFILEDSGASLVLSSTVQRAGLDFALSIPVLVVEEEGLSEQPSHQPVLSRGLEPSDDCYCLYTSGTTGVPKGCEITHENTVQCMLAFKEIFEGRWTPSSRWLQFASLHFDVSVLEQYWSWSVGITLVSAPRDLILEDLAGTINKLQITHIDLTPSLARLIHPDDVPTLRNGVFITGGEALKQEILDVWGSWGVIYNFYGPTEATIGVTVFPRVPQNGRASNIGRQFVNVGSYVLRPGTSIPVLKGAVGELCVSGKLVGKGYLRRGDLTAERFPTLDQFGERVYRTGDLVRVLHDGCFDFLGRADDQVKLRGQRLEIGEINHAIRTGVDEIKDVATIVVRNEKQQKDFLVSFVTSETRVRKGLESQKLHIMNSTESRDLCHRARVACRAKLPGYMVPTYILQLPFIPLSANNKAEIKELKRLFKDLPPDELVTLSSSVNATGASTFTEFGNKIARLIAARQSLDLHTLTPASNIFELGIDSISVLGLARALKKEGFPHANPAIILKNPVLGDLSGALEAQAPLSNASLVAAARQVVQACGHRHRSHVCRELAIPASQIEYIGPCSPLQVGIISRSAIDGSYFNSFRFQLEAGTRISTLRGAWQKTVDAHPILRTRFVKTTDGYVQVASSSLELPWEEMDLLNETESGTEDAIQRRWNAWVTGNSENLTRPFEILLLNGKVLVLHIFHGLYDATSLALVLRRVVSEYLAVEGSPHAQDVITDASKVPSFLEALCHGPLQNFSSCKQFWVEHLKEAISKPLPASGSSPSNSAVMVNREISFHDLELLRKRLGVTHQAIIQAVWCWVLSKHFSVDHTIGIIVSGRTMELDGVERVVGPLFNTLPFHLPFGRMSDLNWATIVRHCYQFNSSVVTFQHVPLRDIQKWCSSGKPLFDVLFSFQREDNHEAGQEKLWKEMDTEPTADYPLALEATLTPSNQLRLLIVGDGTVIGENDARVLLALLENSLAAMAQNPDGDLPIKAARESRVDHGTTANGYGDDTDGGVPREFTWTDKATVLREEMARLAEIVPEAITDKTSILELGLDSIDLIKLSAVLKRHGIKIKTSQLMKARTIPAILHLSSLDGSSPNGVAANGAPNPRRGYPELRELLRLRGHSPKEFDTVLPATPLQDSMVVEMIESNFQLYFNHDILEISADIDIELLKEAWIAVIRGSPILRTAFLPTNDHRFDFAYCQVVTNDGNSDIRVTEVDIQGKQELAKLVDTATQRAKEGGGKSHLLQLVIASAPGKKWLVLSIAHALYDGRSLDLLHQDVQAAYEGHYKLRPPYKPYLEDVILSRSEEAPIFWSGFLDGAATTLLPARLDTFAGHEKIHRAEAVSSLPMTTLKTFCKQHAITTQTLGQACMAALLATRTTSLDVAFGVVLSGRDSEEAENLMFPTMNTVAVRSVLHGTVSSWIRYMQDNAANIAPFSHFPLRKAKKLVKGLIGPLFNALFIQQRRSVPQASESEYKGRIMKSVDGTSAVEYPVCVEMEVGDDGLVWRVACEDGYVSKPEVSVLLHQLDLALGFMVREPDADVMKFSGQSVSVCGLPEFTPKSFIQDEEVTDVNVDDTPFSPIEEKIIGVLADVSGVPTSSILRRHNIYNLGLDSIGAMRVSSALLKKEKILLKFRDIVGAKSIRDMARLVDASKISDANDVPEARKALRDSSQNGQSEVDDRLSDISVELGREPPSPGTPLLSILTRFNCSLSENWVERVLPATAMQVHMLAIWFNTDGELFYPEFRYKLSGDVGINQIGEAWSNLVAETPILRTVFCTTTWEDIPMLQIALKPNANGLSSKIHSPESAPDVQSRTWRSLPSEVVGAMWRLTPSLTATRQRDASWILRLKIHHALYDAVSLPNIIRRFVELCAPVDTNGSGNGQVGFATRGASSEWRVMIKSSYSAENKEPRRKFWLEYFTGVRSCPLSPWSTLRQSTNSRVSVVQESAISDISGLRSLCGKNGVSIQALFLAAYAKFLASARLVSVPSLQNCSQSQLPTERMNGMTSDPKHGLGDRDVIFGIYLANRTAFDGTDGLACYPTLCLVPLRVGVERGKNLFEMAAQVQEDIHTISAPENIGLGLWELQEWTGRTIDSFVNFLSFPVADVNSQNAGQVLKGDHDKVRLGEIPFTSGPAEENTEKAGLVNGGEGELFQLSMCERLPKRVRSSYPDAVDVEASIQDDNSMTIGCFGSSQKLGDENGASEVIRRIVEILSSPEDRGF